MKAFNDLNDIYKDGLIPSSLMEGAYECSVCKKIYKREGAGQRHVERQDCFKYTDMFRGTLVEPILYGMYKTFAHHEYRRKFVPTLSTFRKSPIYTTLSEFWLLCFKNNMTTTTTTHFFEYIINEYLKKYDSYKSDRQYLSAVIKQGTNESSLREYRTECAKGLCTKVMSFEFYDKHSEMLGEDISFTLRSLERGEIVVGHLFHKIDFDEFVDKLSFAERNQLMSFFEKLHD